MKILIMTVMMALPLMGLGQTPAPQQTETQSKETQATAPTKEKKKRTAQEQTKPQAKPGTGTDVRAQTDVKGRAQDVKKNEPGTRSGTSQTNVKSTNQTTKVNVQEFKSRHSEVFSLGRHPKDFSV